MTDSRFDRLRAQMAAAGFADAFEITDEAFARVLWPHLYGIAPIVFAPRRMPCSDGRGASAVRRRRRSVTRPAA